MSELMWVKYMGGTRPLWPHVIYPKTYLLPRPYKIPLRRLTQQILVESMGLTYE